MRFLFLLLAAYVLSAASVVTAQTGSWQPAGATLTFPRTLCSAAQVPAVRASLVQPAVYSVYAGVYATGNGTYPSGNSTSSDRRARARVAKNAAFVLLMNCRPVSNRTDSLTVAQKAAFKAKAKALIAGCNTTIDYSYTEWQWRSKELIDYAIAYDLLRGSGLPADSLLAERAKLQEFAGKLYTEANRSNFTVPGVFFNTIKNNHLLMTTAALGVAAVVLNDMTSSSTAQQPANWAAAALYLQDNVLWRDAQRQSEPGVVAGYAEGPYYFKYAFLNCLPFNRAMGHFLPDLSLSLTWNGSTRSIRNPAYDPNYELLYDWITAISMPDGRLPALEDSYIYLAMPELALTGKSRYLLPLSLQNLASNQLNTLLKQLDDVVDMRAAYIAAAVPTGSLPDQPLTALPASGNLVFRSAGTAQASYLHVYGKNGRSLSSSGGHNQADVSSFILHAHGQLLALDPGYLKYERRSELGNAVNHNMILVDGAGPAMGQPGSANEAEGFVQNARLMGPLAYGEVRTAYMGMNLVRKVLSVRGKYYLLADFISASAPHQYTWQLHGYGLENGTLAQGLFTDGLAQQRGTWLKNGVALLAQVTANGGASLYSKQTSAHELTYDVTEDHTAMLVRKDGQATTQFLAVLAPYQGLAPAVRTLNVASAAALLYEEAGMQDLAFTQTDTAARTVPAGALALPVTSDALLTFVSSDAVSGIVQVYLEQGTSLQYGNLPWLRVSKRASVSWQQTSALSAAGYADRPVTLTVRSLLPVAGISGTTVASWSYAAASQTLTVRLSGAGEFGVSLQALPLPVEWLAVDAVRQGKQAVQVRWRTATETENKSFEVQRSTDPAEGWQTIGSVAGSGTTHRETAYAFPDAAAPAARCYYRLHQLDADGTARLSPVAAVAAAEAAAVLVQHFPVPAHDWLVVRPAAAAAAALRLRLQNMLGVTVLEQTLQAETRLDLSRLSAGTYLLECTDLQTGQRQAERLVVQ